MEAGRTGAIWLASYPKSGNTWLRCLLEAYRRNGLIDINDIRIGHSDGGATLVQALSPMPLAEIGWQTEMLLRPAVLLNLFCRLNAPVFVKTHFANIQPDGGGMPHLIPKQLTTKAIYVVRDPRDVLVSFMRFFRFPPGMAVEAMANKEFRIGGNAQFATTFVSSWSNHVASWVSEKEFPVHVVRYEDLISDAGKELREVLQFLDETVDDERVRLAVEATRLANLREKESSDGFRENASKGEFFGNGGSRWKQELSTAAAEQTVQNHKLVMTELGYAVEHSSI